jgi:hypothetical protein
MGEQGDKDKYSYEFKNIEDFIKKVKRKDVATIDSFTDTKKLITDVEKKLVAFMKDENGTK